MLGEVGMQFLPPFQRLMQTLLRLHLPEGTGIVVVVVRAGEDSFLAEVAPRRVPHLRDRIGGVRDAAVHLVLRLPEAVPGLPADLAGVREVRGLDRFLVLVGEVVVVDLRQDRQRDRGDAPVGDDLFAFAAAAGRTVHHPHLRRPSLGDVVDAGQLASVADAVAVADDRRLEVGTPDLVHAADGLEERRLPLVLLGLIEAIHPELRAHQVRERERLQELAARLDARLHRVTGSRGAEVVVVVVRIDVAEHAEEAEEVLLVDALRFQLGVENPAMDDLRQQLRDPTARVVGDAAVHHGRAAPRFVALEEIRARHHRVDLERNAEEGAVVKDGGVVVREASRPGVQIEIGLVAELACLRLVADLFDDVPVPDGEAAAASLRLCFEDDHFVIRLEQLVGGGQSRDSRADDDHELAVAIGKLGRGCLACRCAPPP